MSNTMFCLLNEFQFDDVPKKEDYPMHTWAQALDERFLSPRTDGVSVRVRNMSLGLSQAAFPAIP